MTTESYQTRMNDLQQLLRSLESDSLSIDELSGKLSQAFELVDALRKNLTQVEVTLDDVISTRMQTDNNPPQSRMDSDTLS